MTTPEQQAVAEPGRAVQGNGRRDYERIVAAARTALLEHGTEAPLDVIARQASVSPGTLSRHFPTRATLIEATYRADMEELRDRAFQLIEELPADQVLAAWMHELVTFMVRRRGLAKAMKAEIGRDSENFSKCRDAARAAAGAVLDRARWAGAARDDVQPRDLLRLGHAVVVASQTDAHRLLSFVIDGLRP